MSTESTSVLSATPLTGSGATRAVTKTAPVEATRRLARQAELASVNSQPSGSTAVPLLVASLVILGGAVLVTRRVFRAVA